MTPTQMTNNEEWEKDYQKWFFENISQFIVRVHFANDNEHATKENLPILEEVFRDFVLSSLHSQKERVVEMCESMKMGDRPTWDDGDPQWWDKCHEGYDHALSDLKTKIEEEI